MKKINGIIIGIALAAFGCKQEKTQMQILADQYAEFELKTDISKLSDNEKVMLRIFMETADIMNEIFWEEAYGDKEQLFAGISDPAMVKYLNINYGPWDRLNGNLPFIKTAGDKPAGANFYPRDMTKKEFEAWEEPLKNDSYSIVRRDAEGKLKLIPYHIAFEGKIKKAAELLNKASELAEDEGLKNYLRLRAQALLTDDYLESDMAWMDMKNNTLDFVVGPIENYEDQLFGYRSSTSGQVLVKDKEWSAKLSAFAPYFQKLQENLPVPEVYKQEKANTNPDINAYDVVYYAGDCNAGSKNIAINLPNDPRVQLAKGSRKLQLKNSMQAKFEKIVIPISRIMIAPEQEKHIKFDAFFENTMFHEVSHGIGIKYTLNEKEEARDALKDSYSAIEEAKADVLGLYCVARMVEWGLLENKDLMDNYVTFVAGIFRSTRFGAASAHGKANMMQFNALLESGAITRNAQGKYLIDKEKMEKEIERLAARYIILEGDGDYEGASRLITEKGVIPRQLQEDLDKIKNAGIPKDIMFIQGPDILGI